MLGAPRVLEEELGTDSAEAERLVGEYVSNYESLSKLYGIDVA